jgi:hypothetical protein
MDEPAFDRWRSEKLGRALLLGTRWSAVKIYEINAAGHNHGVLSGTSGWSPV